MAERLNVGDHVVISTKAADPSLRGAHGVIVDDTCDPEDSHPIRLRINRNGDEDEFWMALHLVTVFDPMPDPTLTEEVTRWLDD